MDISGGYCQTESGIGETVMILLVYSLSHAVPECRGGRLS